MFIYVANWKMNFTTTQACSFVDAHYDDLVELAQQQQLVICPSHDALYPIAQRITNTHIALGAQQCSMHVSGAYTGDVSAASLSELGCAYCIVGHSEQRKYHHVTHQEIAAQVERLLTHSIIPIVCIGESRQEYEAGVTKKVLMEQLDLVTDVLNQYNQKPQTVCIAYEPLFSIGTGIVAPLPHLQEIFAWLQTTSAELVTGISFRFLYGGSINEENAQELKRINPLDGFLIGNASLDFKKIKNIVSC